MSIYYIYCYRESNTFLYQRTSILIMMMNLLIVLHSMKSKVTYEVMISLMVDYLYASIHKSLNQQSMYLFIINKYMYLLLIYTQPFIIIIIAIIIIVVIYDMGELIIV